LARHDECKMSKAPRTSESWLKRDENWDEHVECWLDDFPSL